MAYIRIIQWNYIYKKRLCEMSSSFRLAFYTFSVVAQTIIPPVTERIAPTNKT